MKCAGDTVDILKAIEAAFDEALSFKETKKTANGVVEGLCCAMIGAMSPFTHAEDVAVSGISEDDYDGMHMRYCSALKHLALIDAGEAVAGGALQAGLSA